MGVLACWHHAYLTQSVVKVVLQKSTSPGMFWGSTGVGGGSALDSLAAERLRRTPSPGPSEKGTNQNGSRSCPGDKLRFAAEEEGEKGGCFTVPRETLGGGRFVRKFSCTCPLSHHVWGIGGDKQCGCNNKHHKAPNEIRQLIPHYYECKR